MIIASIWSYSSSHINDARSCEHQMCIDEHIRLYNKKYITYTACIICPSNGDVRICVKYGLSLP